MSRQYYENLRQQILIFIAETPHTTEQIRAHLCETTETTWAMLRALRAAGKIECSRPKTRRIPLRWRVKKEGAKAPPVSTNLS